MRIAVDAMGGDYAPQNIVEGVGLALREQNELETLFLVGDEQIVKKELATQGIRDSRLEVVHASQVVEMSDSAILSVRRKRDSSISIAVDLIKEGRAEAVVSAGHTGASVAATTIKLRTLNGIERPGIASAIPTQTNVCILIDAGANIDAKPIHLLHYAMMGSVYSKHVLGYENPSVGIMSIGEEDIKGSDFTKEVFQLVKDSGLNFRGNIEGSDLFKNPVEVVLCDGFVGNVILKSCEATAGAIFDWLKTEIKKSPVRMAGALMAKGAFQAIKDKTNYETYGGSPLLGVNGICIISHGSSSPLAIKNAIGAAAQSIAQQVNPQIEAAIAQYDAHPATSSPES